MRVTLNDEKQTIRHLTVQDIEIVLAAYFNVDRIECYCMREDWSEPYNTAYPVIVATHRKSVI